LIPDGVTGIFH